MRVPRFLAVLVAFAALAGFAADASAMYNPSPGAFLQRDPGPEGILSPNRAGQYSDGLNLYRYARSNPARLIDPAGLEAKAADDESLWHRTKGDEVKDAGGEFKLRDPDQGTGTVKVYKEVTIERGNKEKKTWQSSSGLLQLEATVKPSCDNCHWLQFAYRYRLDLAGKAIDGYYKGDLFNYLGEKGRHVDSSHPTDPFYDSQGLSRRTKDEISIFDAPTYTLGEKYNETGMVADAYLICNKQIYWWVHWELVAKPDKRRVWSAEYTNITGKATSYFEKWAQDDKLFGGYGTADKETGKLSNPTYYDNPVPEKFRAPPLATAPTPKG